MYICYLYSSNIVDQRRLVISCKRETFSKLYKFKCSSQEHTLLLLDKKYDT